MSMYILTLSGAILREDGAYIPQDPANNDFKDYLAWVEAGNVAGVEPIPPPPPQAISKLTLYSRMTDAELDQLDGFLRTVATVRQRRSWDDAVEIFSDDPQVLGVATALYGADRAAELMAA